MVLLVSMCGFNSCSEDCDYNLIEVDHGKYLVGIWNCFQEILQKLWLASSTLIYF